MSPYLVRMRMLAPLHVGSSTLGEEDIYDYVPSDTLFSGLCHAWLDAFGKEELEGLLGRFEAGDVPFLISSAFPYYQETLFLPPPHVDPPERNDGEEGDRKKLKKADWISLHNFSRLLRGERVVEESNDAKPPDRELLPRVALDRDSANSSIYYVRRAVFPPEGGLWVLLDIRDEGIEPQLRTAFALLGESGVGGERTMGCGRFEPGFEEPPEEISRRLGAEGACVSLSRVAPEHPEEAARVAQYYALVESRGWIFSPTGVGRKRRSAWFFAEGSSFDQPMRGKLVNVTPEHRPDHEVYRYGYGMYVGGLR